MYSLCSDMTFTMPGFPIRTSPGQSLLGGSPRLIAAFHVLRRSLVPRHPPYALNSFNTELLQYLKPNLRVVSNSPIVGIVSF